MRRPYDDVDVKIYFTSFNVEEGNHLYEKKRQLRGQRRKIVTKMLIEKMDANIFLISQITAFCKYFCYSN